MNLTIICKKKKKTGTCVKRNLGNEYIKKKRKYKKHEFDTNIGLLRKRKKIIKKNRTNLTIICKAINIQTRAQTNSKNVYIK